MFEQETEVRALLHHLLREHRQIEGEVLDIERALHCSLPANVIAQRVKRLSATLRKHFREEEEGGLVDDAVSRAPSLSHRASQIENEHPILSQRLQQIASQLNALPKLATCSDELSGEFESFSELLRKHEAKENHLLEDAFGVELD